MGDVFPTIVYVLCFLTSTACAWLLGRSFGRTRNRLLLWSSICFVFLALNNLIVIFDLVIWPEKDFRLAACARFCRGRLADLGLRMGGRRCLSTSLSITSSRARSRSAS